LSNTLQVIIEKIQGIGNNSKYVDGLQIYITEVSSSSPYHKA